MSESFQPENSGATPDKPSDSEPVPLDKTRDALRRLPRESWDRIEHYANKFSYLNRKTLYSPKDLVDEAVKRVLEGARKWNPEHKLETIITGTIKSLASEISKRGKSGPKNDQQGGDQATESSPTGGEMESSDETTEPASPSDETEFREDESAPGKPRRPTEEQGLADQPDFLTPERVILRESGAAKLREKMFQCVGGDPLAIRFISYGLEHPDVRDREAAPALGIAIEELRNLKKRLRRKLGAIKAIRQELAEDPEPQPNPRTLNFRKEV